MRIRTVVAVIAGQVALVLTYGLLLRAFFTMELTTEEGDPGMSSESGALGAVAVVVGVFSLAVFVGGAVAGAISREQRKLACIITGVLAMSQALGPLTESAESATLWGCTLSAIISIPVALAGGQAWARLRPGPRLSSG